MSQRPRILIQLDVDPVPSVFDAVVAVDSGVDHLIQIGGVTPETVVHHVYGAIFTRGGADLARTALFVGGSDVSRAEEVLQTIRSTFIGDALRVSVLLDANGCNTTAAAAVLAAQSSLGGSFTGAHAAVLGATGPVGRRVARLLARQGVKTIALGSRKLERAREVANSLPVSQDQQWIPFSTESSEFFTSRLPDCNVIIAAGAAGVTLLSQDQRERLPERDPRVLIDLNAVPPAGIAGIEMGDRDVDRGSGQRTWGPIGVGGWKMQIHLQAVSRLFTRNDQILEAEDVLEIGQSLALTIA